MQTRTVEQSIEIIRRRLDPEGTKEPVIQRQGLDRILVQLPGVDDPEAVAKVCMDRLMERTDASVVGILWLSDDGMLAPKSVIPAEGADKLQLDTDLTRKVVKEKRAIRIEHDGSDSQKRADSICVPLIVEDEVKGAIHLYRNMEPFRDSHFQLACAMSNIMVRSLARANRHSTLAASHSRLVEKHAAFDEMLGESEAMQSLKSKSKQVYRCRCCRTDVLVPWRSVLACPDNEVEVSLTCSSSEYGGVPVKYVMPLQDV